MKKTAKQSVRMSEVDFLISTYDNRPGLERLLNSIVETYPQAQIIIADSDRNMDRAYYKQLRAEFAEAGLLNRLVVHHISFKAPQGHSFNELLKLSRSKYRLLLIDEDTLTKETDVEQMIRVIKSNKTIGLVGGALNKTAPVIDGKSMRTEDGDVFGETKQVNRFMLLTSDVTVSLRFDPKSDDPALDFSNQAKKHLPFKMVTTNVVLTSDKDFDNEASDQQSNGDNSGASPGTDAPAETGGSDTEGGSASDSAPIGENEKSEDTAPSKRSRRGSA